ncbi:uncharacterized protein N7483_011106 [Penicillium malachiteum]|uniref:uncharacterized protein n=1 Tax=Penicillium malachiteum TaxID=1324776 RepID=UPI0025491B54|nr:uncharacterized protein N7483_011106 [Penicillium malachiteum]KAJ5713925.1 hypothetical protein N7483_011106 [Penicillium malachiteum]
MWMSTVHFYSLSRSTIVGLKDGFSFLWDSHEDSLELLDTNNQIYYGRVKKVRSTPGQNCLHFFRFANCWFALYRDPQDARNDPLSRNRENIIIYHFSWSKYAFHDLMVHIQKVNVDSRRGKIPIMIGYQNKQMVEWRRMCDGRQRQLESVALDKKMREEIISDIKWFYEKDTIDLYERRGIAHRRGYLFYGAPGTGKTSFCHVIATLFELFRTLPESPERCLVLLDDFDAAGITRQGSVVNNGSVEKGQGRVTMATLLGVLDGIGTHEYLLVATTNVKPDLDPALNRPGRIDKEYEFENPDHSTLEEYFNYFFDCRKTGTDGLAAKFARHVSEGMVTPATIQEYFLKCNDSVTALAKVEQLVS